MLGGVFVSGHTQFRNVAPIFFRSSIEPVNGIDPNSLSKPPYYRLKRRQKTRNQSYANCRWAASRSKRIKTVILLTFQHSGITGCEIGMQGFYKHLSFFFFLQIIKIERTPDSNSTNVTVIFQVLNGSEPVAAHPVIRSIERASISLEQAVGYKVLIIQFL